MRLFLLVFLVQCSWSSLAAVETAPSGDEVWQRELGVFAPAAVAGDAELVSLVSSWVTAVEKDLPAQAMGLQVGDRLVGLDGLQVIGPGEWDLVRFCRPTQPENMRIAVLRDRRVIELETRRVLPVRRLGCSFGLERDPYRVALRRAGFVAAEGVGVDIGTFPLRAGLALLRWHAHAKPAAERAWIPALAAQFLALADQRWADAAAMPAVAVPDTCRELQRLTRFFGALAAWHRDGEREPDPARHGEPLNYYVIHYPYPAIRLPERGAFIHPAADFITALDTLRDRPDHLTVGMQLSDSQESVDGEGSYAYTVRKALLDPLNHGGWPYRHHAIHERGSRAEVLAGLRAQAGGDGPFAAWSRFVLMPALMTDAADQRRDDPLGEGLAQLKQVESPLMRYLGLEILDGACRYWDEEGMRERLRAALDAGPLPGPNRPSRLLAHLRAHEASLVFHLFPERTFVLTLSLDRVFTALSRALPLAELRRRLAAPDVARLPLADRRELMAHARSYFRASCQREDLVAMSRVDLPGALVDAVGEIALWHNRPRNDESWIFAAFDEALRPQIVARTLPRMQQAIAAIPWADAPAATAAVEEAYLVAGTPHAAALLADACATRGRADLAEDLRVRRLTRTFARLDDLGEAMKFRRSLRLALDEFQLAAFGPVPVMRQESIAAGERYVKREKPKEDWDSVHLYRAHAFAVAGRTADAVESLCRSFTAAKTDDKPFFFTSEKVITDCLGFRTVLLRQLIAGQGFGAAERQRVAAAARSDLVDDAFAALLGVQRSALTGAGVGGKPAKGADDF